MPEPSSLKLTTLASGLSGPIALKKDASGRIWVAESGTGKDDGRLSMITDDGKIYPVITGFDSGIIMGGEVEGLNHLIFADGLLYILGSHSRLYKANVAAFKPGDTPMMAKNLDVEDKKQFILDYKFPAGQDTEDTHLYNMTLGPNGDLYFADAAANAIIRRTKAGVWSVFAYVPGIKNPTPVGGPFVESVPTGIVFDGQKFLVTTLLGFPFPAGQALIYQVDQAGTVLPYKNGFTSLVAINLDNLLGGLVVQHGIFGMMGFGHNSGQLIQITSGGTSVLADKLDLPTDVERGDAHTLYVSSLGVGLTGGMIQKITY